MKKITVVIATEAKSLEDFTKKPIYKTLKAQTQLHDFSKFDFIIMKDNKEGLSKIYNQFLQDLKFEKDILLFVHDDVELVDIELVEKLNNSPYVVTGLAGCKKIDLAKPPAWHLMSNREDYVGEVAHKNEELEWTTVFGPTKSRALLIDGLFIAVDASKAKEKLVKFDEDFLFHHYDLAFCLDCNKKKASVGVLPIKVIHHGLGDSMLSKEWKQSADNFIEKYTKTNYTKK